MKGTVKWWSDEKGYGFISPENGSKDLFVHFSEIQTDSKFKTLHENDSVEFEVQQSDKGPRAANVVAA